MFSSSEDLETNVKKVSGSATEQGKEEGHVIPGNVQEGRGISRLSPFHGHPFPLFYPSLSLYPSILQLPSLLPQPHTGDTLYYSVELEPVSEAKYPRYSFSVTGTQEGRLEHRAGLNSDKPLKIGSNQDSAVYRNFVKGG